MINLTIDNRILFGFILVVAIFNFILFISMVRHRVKYRRLFKSYDNFMAGKSARNLEDIIILLRKDIRSLKSESRLNREAIHSRETTFNYIKIVENGQTDQVLTDEEKIVLEQALGYRER